MFKEFIQNKNVKSGKSSMDNLPMESKLKGISQRQDLHRGVKSCLYTQKTTNVVRVEVREKRD